MLNTQPDTEVKSLVVSSAGRNQPSRETAIADQSAFAIQDKSIKDWFAYIRTFARKIRFFNGQTGSGEGFWTTALPTEEQAMWLQHAAKTGVVDESIREEIKRPDWVMWLALFKMLSHTQTQMNHVLNRQLNHYYQDILKFSPLPPKPDQGHLVLTLADHVQDYTLLKGTEFLAGQDANGKDIVYETLQHTRLNKANVSHVSVMSNLSANGLLQKTMALDTVEGVELNEKGVLAFGEDRQTNTDDSEHLETSTFPDQGFLLSSNMLYLQGGERIIVMAFEYAPDFSGEPLDLSTLLDVAISTQDEVVPLQQSQSDQPQEDEIYSLIWGEENLSLAIRLSPLFPPVMPCETITDIEKPFLQFKLRNDVLENPDFTDAINSMRSNILTRLGLHVSVMGAPGVLMSADNNALDTLKPLNPFGLNPRLGSKFELTHPELWVKPIGEAKVRFEWSGLPDWDTYYKAYTEYLTSKDTNYSPCWGENDVLVKQSNVLDEAFSVELFEEGATSELTITPNENGPILDWQTLPLTETKAALWPASVSFTLGQCDFGHNIYALVNQYAAYKNSQEIQKAINDSSYTPVILEVSTPYTPLIDRVVLDYEGCEQIGVIPLAPQNELQSSLAESGEEIEVEVGEEEAEGEIEEEQSFGESISDALDQCDAAGVAGLRSIDPFGYPPMPYDLNGQLALLPQVKANGYLYIGLDHLEKDQTNQMRLYFQMDPVDGSNVSNDVILSWQYLSDSGWQYFDTLQANSGRIIEDSTLGLLNSGIVAFELPDNMAVENYIRSGSVWIRAMLTDPNFVQGKNQKNALRYSRIRGVFAQGVHVRLKGDGYHLDHYAQPLPSETIAELSEADSSVAELSQPFPTFDARQGENESALSVRAAERLRHKNRALTLWDYETLALAEFPELYMARCFTVDTSETSRTIAMVVVPKNFDASVIQPKVPLFLKEKISLSMNRVSMSSVDVEVLDPEYEEVTIDVSAKISEDFDIESVEDELNNLIIENMTPWNADATSMLQKKDIYLTDLTVVLEQHPAVELIYVLRASQAIRDKEDGTLTYKSYDYTPDNEAGNRIEPSNPSAILVPAKKHQISRFNKDLNEVEGIGVWRIDFEFRVA